MISIDYSDRLGRSGLQLSHCVNVIDEIGRVSRQRNLKVLTLRLVEGLGGCWLILLPMFPMVVCGCRMIFLKLVCVS